MKDERPHVLVIAAVEAELDGVIREIQDAVIRKTEHQTLIYGHLKGYPVHLLITGPGMVNSAGSVTCAILSLHPDLMIQTGCAGGFEAAGVNIGDICIADEEIDAQLGIESADVKNNIDDLPFPIFRQNGFDFKNRYPLDKQLSDLAYQVLLKSPAGGLNGIHRGPFITVSTITATDQRANALYNQFHPCMESMEGSAAALVSIRFGIPLIEIRSAANRVGKRDRNAWNLPLAFENCCLGILAMFESDEINFLGRIEWKR